MNLYVNSARQFMQSDLEYDGASMCQKMLHQVNRKRTNKH